MQAATPPVDTEPSVSDAGVEPAWNPLFDGKSLDGWSITNFGGEGPISVQDGTIVMDFGSPLTGITRTGSIPSGEYELELEAMRIDGNDFFCGLTFPAKGSHCSLIIGGWGGGLVGISSLNGFDASENETARFMSFESDRWYHIRVRVTPKRLQAWIDQEEIIDQDIENRKLSTRGEVDLSKPLGVSTFETRAALRNLQWRPWTDSRETP